MVTAILPLLAARSGADVARDDLGTAALLLAVAGWIVYLVALDRWGRDPRARAGDHGAGPLDLPDDPPALAHALHHGGEPEADLLGTIVLDLARRGYLDIAEQDRGPLASASGTAEWHFRRNEPPQGDLRPYENALYTRLFASGSEASLADLRRWADANRQQARVFLERVRRYVAADLRARGYLERPQRLPAALNLGSAALVIVVGLAALLSGAWLGLLAVASGVVQASRNRTLRRRTAHGSARARQWSTVASDLRRVGELEEAPEDGPTGWERLLVYASALGVTEEYVAGLQQRAPKVLANAEFASWYRPAGMDSGPVGSIGRLPHAIGRSIGDVADAPAWAPAGGLAAVRLSPRASSPEGQG